jgi:hypothetical protein
MAGKTLSYHANEAVVGWISGQAALEGRSTSQIIGDALQLYRALPETARRSLRLARQRGQEGPVMRVAARHPHCAGGGEPARDRRADPRHRPAAAGHGRGSARGGGPPRRSGVSRCCGSASTSTSSSPTSWPRPPGGATPRHPPEVISHAIWLYFRFPLSLRVVEERIQTYSELARLAVQKGDIGTAVRAQDSITKIAGLFSEDRRNARDPIAELPRELRDQLLALARAKLDPVH